MKLLNVVAVCVVVTAPLVASTSLEEFNRTFWSVQPVANPQPPVVRDSAWTRNPVDRFILERLQARGLTAGSPASRRALIRRATFDLTGLPPRPAEINAFLEDTSDEAFDTLVERLLASRHYGERWGRHWLDLARYADTAGDAADFPVPEAYKYRNYVIDAFNKDKPYDQFIREQIAGDLLASTDEEQRWERMVATGYLAISRRIGVSPQNLRHITLEDTINNLGKTFLGLSIGCARCHDHKFDPIPTADYYALYGILDSSVFPHAGAEHKPHRNDFVYRAGRDVADQCLEQHRKELEVWNKKERKQFELYRSFQNRKVTDPELTRASTWADLMKLRDARAAFARTFPDLEIAYAVQEGEPHDVAIMKAGDPKSRGPVVRRGFLQVLGGQTLPKGHQGSGRRELADWIADPANPLTARVMVNRIWHYHFGVGLVRSTSDFGVRGTPPTHPELLDFLARYFIDNGWSVKAMHRLIMSSRTYQLSSRSVGGNREVDPDNRLLWRAHRNRLDAEQIRDAWLQFSGELDLSPGGRHPFPHHLTYFYRQHEPFQEAYPTFRRSVYQLQQRIQKNPYLDLFDGPDGSLHFGERRATTTTLQALYLMNSGFVHERSRRIAARMIEAQPTTAGRVTLAYETFFGRPPSADEIKHAERHFARATPLLAATGHEGRAAKELAWAGYVRGMLASNEFMFVD